MYRVVKIDVAMFKYHYFLKKMFGVHLYECIRAERDRDKK